MFKTCFSIMVIHFIQTEKMKLRKTEKQSMISDGSIPSVLFKIKKRRLLIQYVGNHNFEQASVIAKTKQ